MVKVPAGHRLLAGLPCNSVLHTELASLDAVCKKVDHGAVIWFTLVHPVEPPNVMGACGILAGGESGDI